MRLTHVITGLSVGGAETALYRLVQGLRGAAYDQRVISLSGLGVIGPRIQALGIPVDHLGLTSIAALPGAVRRLSQMCNDDSDRSGIVHAWMYHANLMTALALPWIRRRPRLVWGIRESFDSWSSFKFPTQQVIRMGGVVSRYPDAVIYNSQDARTRHEGIGYKNEHSEVIPNGFDAAQFRASQSNRQAVRDELGIASDDLVVGCVGLYHPAQKGNDVFIQMGNQLLQRRSNVKLICVGRGMEWSNTELVRYINSGISTGTIHLLGQRSDLPRIYAAMDIFVNPSRAESFPNVIAEAMLTELVCVVTKAGDSEFIVGENGSVVDSVNILREVERWLEVSDHERREIGVAGRQSIINRFSLDRCTESYQSVYRKLLEDPSR